MTTTLRRQKDLERKERTRRRLLDAAATVFVRLGYRKTKISDIVGEAGVGQGTFYRSFADKRQIFEMLFEDFAARLLGEFVGFSANLPRNQEEYLKASVDAVARVAWQLDKRRELALLFLREGPAVDRVFEEMIGELLDQFAALAQSYLDHAIGSGFARSCDSAVVSQCLVGIARRQLDNFLKGRIPQQAMETTVSEAVRFAFFGFGIPTKRRS